MTREEIEAEVSVRLGVLLHAGTNAAAIETFADLIERVRDEAVRACERAAKRERVQGAMHGVVYCDVNGTEIASEIRALYPSAFKESTHD